MEMRIVHRVITGSIIAGFFVALSGCGYGVWHKTTVRNVPEEVNATISIGDTRQKVRSLIGDPLIDARDIGVEVYRNAGRDVDVILAIVPIPVPGDKAVVFILVVYDEDDVVKVIAPRIWGGQLSWKLGADGFIFTNS